MKTERQMLSDSTDEVPEVLTFINLEGLPGLQGNVTLELLLNRYGISTGENGKVLEMGGANICTISMCTTHLSAIKKVDLMLYVFYLYSK